MDYYLSSGCSERPLPSSHSSAIVTSFSLSLPSLTYLSSSMWSSLHTTWSIHQDWIDRICFILIRIDMPHFPIGNQHNQQPTVDSQLVRLRHWFDTTTPPTMSFDSFGLALSLPPCPFFFDILPFVIYPLTRVPNLEAFILLWNAHIAQLINPSSLWAYILSKQTWCCGMWSLLC